MKAFTYRSGPLHLINPETSISFCRIEKNPGSPLKAEHLKPYNSTVLVDEPNKKLCKNCRLVQRTIAEVRAGQLQIKNSKAVPVLLPCNLPDLLSTPFYTLMSCIQEYSRVRSY